MEDRAGRRGKVATDCSESEVRYYKEDFWRQENLKFGQSYYRLEKSARIISSIARGREISLLDVGCGPATLMRLLPPSVDYTGIDIAIQEPAPHLIEADLVESPIDFDGRRFDIVIAQGFFEYMGNCQSQKLSEIANILAADGKFIVSYWNFDHRNKEIYWPFSNICSIDEFRNGLSAYFKIDRSFPASHNWRQGVPARRLNKAINMNLNANIPVISRKLAVEYYFICSLASSGTAVS